MVSVDYLRNEIYSSIITYLKSNVTYFKVGTSADTPSETTLTDLIVPIEITSGVEIKLVDSLASTTKSIVATCILDYTEANGNSLREIGLYDASENLLVRKTFTAVSGVKSSVVTVTSFPLILTTPEFTVTVKPVFVTTSHPDFTEYPLMACASASVCVICIISPSFICNNCALLFLCNNYYIYIFIIFGFFTLGISCHCAFEIFIA